MSGVMCDHSVSRNERKRAESGDVARRVATLRERQEAELQVVEIKMLHFAFQMRRRERIVKESITGRGERVRCLEIKSRPGSGALDTSRGEREYMRRKTLRMET